jgi:hypothetical protein
MNRIRKLGLFYAIRGAIECRGATSLGWMCCTKVQLKLIPASKSGLGRALVTQPENFLVALFVLSPTLWLLVFLACYAGRRVALALSSIL